MTWSANVSRPSAIAHRPREGVQMYIKGGLLTLIVIVIVVVILL